MALNFGKPQQPIITTAENAGTSAPVVEAAPEKYDIVADRSQLNTQLAGSEEVEQISAEIEVYNLDTIVTFGAEAAEQISKSSDMVLNSMNMSQLDGSSELLKTLANIMSKFDIEEIKDDPSFFGKLFGGMRKQLDKILAKYQTMGGEVDKIFVQLRKYEDEIRQSNRSLDEMFNANVEYYHTLVKYIIAGEQGCKEIEDYIAQRTADYQASGDESIQFEITQLNQALMMLE